MNSINVLSPFQLAADFEAASSLLHVSSSFLYYMGASLKGQ